MIRPIESRDLGRLKELEIGFSWEFGTDYMAGLVYVDRDDQPVMFVGAWRLAEVHLVVDPAWKNPALRMVALQHIHDAMSAELRNLGVKRTVTWMDGMKAFGRRLLKLGWIKSSITSWIKEI